MRWVRRISTALTLGLLLQTGVAADALASSQSAEAPLPPAAPAAPSTEAPDEASALLAARLQGRRIEVTKARTEFVTLWANPDGTLTSEHSTGPLRMKVGDAWVPVDSTLVQTPDGKLAPKAHPQGLVLEGGDAGVTVGDSLPTTPGSASAKGASAAPLADQPSAPSGPLANPAGPVPAERPLVSIGSGDQQVSFGWLGRLPKPRVEGSKATYVDARPGVDLVLQATRTGFEQFLIVKDRSAVSQAGTVTIPLDASGLTVAPQQDGSVHLLEKVSGKPAVKIPTPVMWDAAVDQASQEHLNRAPVTLEVRGQGSDTELVFTPNAAFLADAKTQYPVTIDPPVDVVSTYDTYVQTNENGDVSSSVDLKLGSYDGTTVARSFLTFPSADFSGKQILDAKLNLYNYHSSHCTPKQWEVWDAQGAGWWTRWNAQPTWGQKRATSNDTFDEDPNDSHQCTRPDGSVWAQADITNLIQVFADHHYFEYGIALKAADESSSLSWKRFSSAEGGAPPYISITYNTVPATPATVEVLPSQPGTPKYTSDANPRFQVQAVDADGDQVKVYFELRRAGQLLGSIVKDTPNGAIATARASDFGIARLDEGVQYSIWSMVEDAHARSNWTETPLVADTVKPGAPFVTSADYPSDGLWHGAANQAGSFTFTPPSGTDDLVGYVYTLDGGTPVTVDATAALTTSITPTTEGRRVLSVQAKDRAGNLS
ncbi:DNRLRE domain-containing protein, partial [Kitasatospora sp. NPDC015120]|uniref:DNRLRE domain-containing protein n=1 Tax=Kitasatospora sp. NPDC015120 TaxID=3364023 RepID=UPI0036F47654